MIKKQSLFWIYLSILLSFILFFLMANAALERNERLGLISQIAEFMPRVGAPGYEHFDLNKEETKLLNKMIEEMLKKSYYFAEDLTKIYVLLYIKHDTMPHDFLSEKQRQIFIQKISQVVPKDFDTKVRQIRLLKYGLGINNVGELKNPLGVCEKDGLLLNDFNWETLERIDGFFEIINFCKIDYKGNINLKRINELLSMADNASKEHFKEHGLNNVPVYVNDCSPAKNGNETYHCLYFKNPEQK